MAAQWCYGRGGASFLIKNLEYQFIPISSRVNNDDKNLKNYNNVCIDKI